METIKPKLAQKILRMVEQKIRTDPNQVQEKNFSAGEHLIKQGDDSQEMFVILKGEVKIYYATLKSNEYLLAIAGPGEIVGEVEILTGEKSLCSVEILMDSRVAVFKKNIYKRWLQEKPDFALLINQILCYRLQKISTRAAVHLTYPLEYSVLKLIKESAFKKSSLTIKISRNEIANYLGTSIRSINRILRKLHNQELLIVSKNEIKILSMDFLNKFLAIHEN